MVRVSMAAGVAVDIVAGSIPCEVSKPPLYPRSDIEESYMLIR